MQPFQLLIMESQAARRRLYKTFELPNDIRSQLEHDGVVQSRERRRSSLCRPWKRYSRTTTKKVFVARAVVGMAAFGTPSGAPMVAGAVRVRKSPSGRDAHGAAM